MKKIISVAAVVLIVLIFCAGAVFFFKSEKEENVQNSQETDLAGNELYAYMITEKYPTDIIWIGNTDEFEFTAGAGDGTCIWHDTDADITLYVRKTDHITQEILNRSSEYQYTLVVVNDINGDVQLTDDEYLLVYDNFLRDSHFYFFYIGKNQLDNFAKLGFYEEDAPRDIDYAASFYRYQPDGEPVCGWGTYTITNIQYDLSIWSAIQYHYISTLQ